MADDWTVASTKAAPAQDPWAPVSAKPATQGGWTVASTKAASAQAPWAPVSTKPAPPVAPSAAQQIDKSLAGLPGKAAGYVAGKYVEDVKGSFGQIGQDVKEDIAKQKAKPGGLRDLVDPVLHPTQAGGLLRPVKEAMDVVGAAQSPFVSAPYRALVAAPLAEAESRIPGQVGAQQEREQKAEAGNMVALNALRPGKEFGAGRPISVNPKLPPVAELPKAPAGKTPPAKGSAPAPTGVVGNEPDFVERIDNALFRLGGHSTAGRLEALQDVHELPKEVRDPKVQEALLHAIEQRMVDPKAPIPKELQAAYKAWKPWSERQRVAINNVRERLKAKGLTDAEIEPYAPDTGYVPRRAEGKSPGLDQPKSTEGPERRDPLAWSDKRALTKTTSSLKARNQIVLQFEDGARRFEHRNKANEEWRPGMTVRDPLTGKTAEVKHATIKEIEGAKAQGSDDKPLIYHKNPLLTTIDEALRAERVDRNLDALDALTAHAKEQGLAHQDEWHYKNDEGQWVRAKANTRRPEGFVELPHIPQLKGWSFSSKVAEVLKDYYPDPDEPGDAVIAKVNRMLNASLFVTPFPHIKNVGTMGFIGRGWDWLPTAGNYGRLMRTGRQAIQEVLTVGPKYRQMLREGSALMAGDDATRNFYQTLLQSAVKGLEGDSKAIKAAGLNPVDIVKSIYAASHKMLWNVNDMVLLQRQLELEQKGMSTREAIKESERWIANYRIPSQVMRSRAVRQIIADGKWVNFGRYTYGKWRAIGEMLKGVTSKDPQERLNASGKIAAAGVTALIIYPLMDKMLQGATGNPKARFGRGGELAPVDAALDPEKDWAGKVSAVLTPAPLNEKAMEVANNRNLYTGRHIVEPQSTPKGQAVQAGEYAAGGFYPFELGQEALQPGGGIQALGRLAGASIPPSNKTAAKAKAKKYDRRSARRREQRDPIERLF